MSSFSIEKVAKRNIALDIMKCIGVFFITNAHSWDLWEVINRRIAVGGAQGVTVFFFASGYAMMIGSTKEKSYDDFICDKLKRLWPSLFIWLLFSSLFFDEILTLKSFFALEFRWWFISCIFLYYAILYFAVNRRISTKIMFMLGGTFFACLMIVLLPNTDHSIFVDYHYYMYFPSMALGMVIADRANQISKDDNVKVMKRILFLSISLFSFFAYFLVVHYCSGVDNQYYYFQLLNFIALNMMVLFLYYAFEGDKINEFVRAHICLRYPIILISQLSLEIYIVQVVLLTGKFNSLFPLSFLINAIIVLVFAYVLRVLTNLFIHIFDKKMTIKKCFVI